MRSETNVLGRMWWPVRIGDVPIEKVLSVWLNSSLGILSLMVARNTTQGSWVQLKKADLGELPVLDPRRLSSSQLKRLAKLFDKVAHEEFERLSGMALCPARRSLDDGIARILDLPDLGKLREMLASEPVVSNRRL